MARTRPRGAWLRHAIATAAAAAITLAVFAGAASAANFAPDPDFEASPFASYSTNGSGTFSWATDQSRSATHSLKIVSATSTLNRWLSSLPAIPATAGTQYTACVFMKAQGVAQQAFLSVNFWTAGSVYIPATVDSPTKLTGTADWTQVCLTTTAPASTAFLRVEFRLQGPGTLWADDVSVENAATGSPPSSTTAPVASGSVTVGGVVSTTTGSWTDSPSTFATLWFACTDGSSVPPSANCNDIVGATSSSFTLTSSQLGKFVRARVRATGPGGTGEAYSNSLGPVTGPAPTVVVVKAGNLAVDATHWYFYDDVADTATATQLPGKYQFANGAGTPPAGVGSVKFRTTGSERWNMATSQYGGTKLSDLTSLRFSTYEPAANPGSGRAVYLNFDVDFAASVPGYQGRLVYVPEVNGTVLDDTWQEWDGLASGALWTWSHFGSNGNKWPDDNTSQYRTWSAILAAFPNARINAGAGSSQLLLRAGEPYPDGFTGFLDKVVVGVGAAATAYDFEPSPASTVVVTPGSVDGWVFSSADENGAVPSVHGAGADLAYGPATPPLGTGSATLFTGYAHGEEAGTLRNTGFSGTRLDAIATLNYCTYVTVNNGQQAPYLSLEIATGGSGAPDDRLFFEPPYQTPSTGNPALPDQGAVAAHTWQCWDAAAGGWWSNSGDGGLNPGTNVKSLSAYLAVHPNATIVNKADGSGAIRIAVGFASPGDTFNGSVDKVEIGLGGGSTTYDFEAGTPIAVSPATLVAPAATGGWYTWDDSTDSSPAVKAAFVSGPAGQPLGTGSGQLTASVATDRPAFATNDYLGTRLANITTLGYSSFQPGPTLAIALQFDIRYRPSDVAYGGRLVFEPYQTTGTVGSGWQTWTPLNGKWWASKTTAAGSNGLCAQATPCTWDEVLQDFPDAAIQGRLLFRAGAPWTGFVGNVDAFAIGVGTTVKTYDFEPGAVAPTNLAPDPDFEASPFTSYFTNGTGAFSWATDQSHSATHSLKIVSATFTLNRWLSNTNAIAVTPGQQYTACAYLKTQGAAQPAHLSVNFWTASQVYIPATVDSAVKVSGTTDWTQACITATAPASAASIRLEFRLPGPGTLWIDDVSVTHP